VPRFLARLIYAIRGKRRVRLHIEDKPGVQMPSIEGVMLGRWSGHYILLVPKLIHGADQSIALEGMVEVPAERVVFVQVL
jgi:hypothetical protein